MIRRSLPAVFALMFAAPLLAAPAGQQTLFNFVRPADVVQVATQDASLPQSNAEQTAEGEVLRRVTFNPVAQPTLRLTPANRCLGLVAVGRHEPADPERDELGRDPVRENPEQRRQDPGQSRRSAGRPGANPAGAAAADLHR